MARREHKASEYADLLERYIEQLSLQVTRKSWLDEKCEFALTGDRFERLSGGQAEVYVSDEGLIRFECRLRIPVIEEKRDLLLRAINRLNSNGAGSLSFYLLTAGEVWHFAAETCLRMDSCNCASARRQAQEVIGRMWHVRHALDRLEQELPEFSGADSPDAPDKEASDCDLGADDEDCLDNLEQACFDEDDEEFDFSDGEPQSGDMCDEDELIGRYKREGAGSFSGSELVRLHFALRRKVQKKKEELARLRQIQSAPEADEDCTPEDTAEDDGVQPDWDPDWGDEAEILRRADEEGSEGLSFFDLFLLNVARSREDARREKGLAPLYRPRGNAEGPAAESAGEKPVRNIPLRPAKR